MGEALLNCPLNKQASQLIELRYAISWFIASWHPLATMTLY